MLYALSGADRSAFTDSELPHSTPLFRPTFAGEGIVRCDDVLKHPDYGKSGPHHGLPAGHLPVRSYLAVPVVSRTGTVHGGLLLGHPEPGRFTRRDELIAGGIASQAAIAIDNAQLFQANERAREELRQLNAHLEERIAAQVEKVRKAELQLQRVVAGISDYAIFLLDAEGNVQTWNLGAQRIKGYAASEIIGTSFERFYTKEDRLAGVPQHALEMARKHGHYDMESWRVRKDGSRFWANVHISAIHDEDRGVIGFVKITRDRTEHKHFEDQLRQAQKMEAVGQLTGGVAHDFNNLLTIILGNLELIKRSQPTDPRIGKAAEQAARGAERAATLTRQLLAFSRRQPLEPKPTNINQLVGGMTELLQRTLGENITVKTMLAGAWRCEVDAHQLESAIVNLAVNARDAMPEGGTLMLEVTNVHVDGEPFGREIAGGDYVVICITDTGTGMSAEVLERATEPFFTTKPIGQGTGLGLSQVYGFVKQSGGHLTIYSEQGHGTAVKIYLPRFEGEEKVATDIADWTGRLRGSEAILLVEDEEGVREYCAEALRELGYTVFEANDADAAMKVLEQSRHVDLLVTDVGLPGVHGGDLAREAVQRQPELPVLFVSGYPREAIAHRGRISTDTELLLKPYSRLELARRVRKLLDARATRAAWVLLVEDDAMLRELISQMLLDIGFNPIGAGTLQEARETLRLHGAPDLALIDVSLGEESGLAVLRELREIKPGCPAVVASGYGDSVPGGESLRDDPNLIVLSKPYDLQSLKDAIAALGL